ncbi:PREDICTED: RNA-binding protein 5-like [Priapulus caudatus]|uniref:RNA-binding protein 5-like n=1 Tax=Priapulus caudatus TaxID=37621 RepID=A0ABM1E609_PRICU|nr:PREDICTED: RNA-binding protein 5-like [Priapulus caudatus]
MLCSLCCRFVPVGPQQLSQHMSEGEKTSGAADAGFALLTKKNEHDTKLMPPPPPLGMRPKNMPPAHSLVANDYGDDSEPEEESQVEEMAPLVNFSAAAAVAAPGGIEAKITDWDKLACLLCRRQFSSKEMLLRHQQMSDLHKQNHRDAA